MEVLSQLASIPRTSEANNEQIGEYPSRKAPLILIHGTFHAAWCWKYFQRYFSELGFDSYAVSLRGAGKTLIAEGEECLLRGKVTLEEHLADLDALLCELKIPPPVVVGHSSGGLVAQKWTHRSPAGKFAGLVLLASKPPYGHNWLTWRIMRKIGLLATWRLTMAFVRKTAATDVDLCREMFFSKKGTQFDEDMEGDHRLLEYMQYFRDQSFLSIDVKSSQKPLVNPGSLAGKTLVIGGEEDYIVDHVAVRDTASFFGAKGEEVLIPNAPHDLMLCSSWRVVASEITNWLVERGY